MNVFHKTKWCLFTALVSLLSLGQHAAAQQSAVKQDGVEVLTRGPIHEAFAETVTFDPEPAVVVAKTPPAPIEEISPDKRPQGANVTWIPGYWGWDDERNDFLWISGIWRTLPPGRQWVPGYWSESQQGSQWTSGYWADASATQIEYLPEPPATAESGPNVAAPSADDVWLPGSWIWQNNRYGWRAGYWSKGNPDWDWVPDHYVWTPRGYIFVDGYYDYSVQRRGVVFAPVYFHGGLNSDRNLSYSPSTAINPSVFVRHLFVRPGYGHYYFGDYYDSNYANAGYSPWFSFQSSRRGYDPIYANQRWHNRRDREWEQRTETDFQSLRDNQSARPPRNWAAQSAIIDLDNAPDDGNAVALPLDLLARRKNASVRFTPVNPAERQQFVKRRLQYRKYLQERQQSEAGAAILPGGDPTATVGPARTTFTNSPFATSAPEEASSPEELDGDFARPQRHQVLKPDFQVQPQPRVRSRTLGTGLADNPGTAAEAVRQIKDAPQAQPQLPNVNRDAGQTAPINESQGQDANRVENPQAAAAEQSQGQDANPEESRQDSSEGSQQDSPAEEPEK